MLFMVDFKINGFIDSFFNSVHAANRLSSRIFGYNNKVASCNGVYVSMHLLISSYSLPVYCACLERRMPSISVNELLHRFGYFRFHRLHIVFHTKSPYH